MKGIEFNVDYLSFSTFKDAAPLASGIIIPDSKFMVSAMLHVICCFSLAAFKIFKVNLTVFQ